MTFPEGCVVIGVIALGILVPNAPGFFGTYQLSVYAALLLYFPTETVSGPGSAFVFLIYGSQVLIAFLGGAFGMLLDRIRLQDALSTDAATTNLPERAQPE
jgi:hypothetical protein